VIKKISTPLGEMIAFANLDGLCLLKFSDSAKITELISQIAQINHYHHQYQPETVLKQTQAQISEYFNQQRKIFTLPINCYGTTFQQAAWDILKKIPYGTTLSYQAQAIALNKPNAYRAVATANGHNKIALIIPCHRVIRKNNSAGDYAGKRYRKEFLLTLEKNNKP
jgi:AraC family transcriptional regulator of adaptative response/methylated-DNA-[protein]-cysteine methyltransferase